MTESIEGVRVVEVVQTALVSIKVRKGSDAITRITGPDGDGWRRDLYPLHTEWDIFNMWADNCVRNGIEDASRLEGWGDLAEGEVTMEVVRSETDSWTGDG